nr:beta-1,6-N-acetylglucosaminyltransferase [Sulfitobacter algicola]
MLVHTALDRAEQVARHWASHGCPVVIHADKLVPQDEYQKFAASLSNLQNVRVFRKFSCEWGTWGLVAASQAASEIALSEFPDIGHVYLTSGACLPLRPVEELVDYLAGHADVDFIESASICDVPWTIGGLDTERFSLFFPFSWKQQRYLFDRSVDVQRLLRIKRKVPGNLTPHLGSQWWCLTRNTMTKVLADPNRTKYDRYFSKVWIPDESYFQTLSRLHSRHIESRSLTLAKFDFQGKPHVFYDDHLPLLHRSDCFVARKIWPYADKLYQEFLNRPTSQLRRAEPIPQKIDRIFDKAVERRTRGRPGLLMQSRFPKKGWENNITNSEYSVFEGFDQVIEDFPAWLASVTKARVHGHLFACDRVEFDDGQTVFDGCLSNQPGLRDYAPKDFLLNLVWNTQGEHQCFQFGPQDKQKISQTLVQDANARISVITGAWAIALSKSTEPAEIIRKRAASFQRIEKAHIELLRSSKTKAKVKIWSLAEFLEAPVEHLQPIVKTISKLPHSPLTEAPKLTDLSGFGTFLQQLKNMGMPPYLIGDFPIAEDTKDGVRTYRKSRVMR